MKTITILFILIFSSCAFNKHQNHFVNIKKWVKLFENDKREIWQRPNLVINRVGVKKDSIIADIGSATGYFPVRLAKKANKGRVWAIDIEPQLVNYLNQRAKKEQISNLTSILGTKSDAMIPEAVDFIFSVDTYHHIKNRKDYFKNLQKKLKEEGKVVIIDFKKGDFPIGPPNSAKISRENVIKEMKQAGLQLKRTHDFLIYQYILVFTKS